MEQEHSVRYLNRDISGKKERPVRVLQFGEGNFLRGFADEMIDIANDRGFFNGDIVMVKPRNSGSLDHFRRQQCQYTVSRRGITGGVAGTVDRIITSVADVLSAYADYDRVMELAHLDTLRFVISNTTEAGIAFDAADECSMAPPSSYPAKLTQFLYERFRYFEGAQDRGLFILPLELIEENAVRLKECVVKYIELWKLEADFSKWVDEACLMAPTLVDRIVPGYPKAEAASLWEEWGYVDELAVVGEPFALWVIEAGDSRLASRLREEFPLDQAGLPVLFTDNHKPYKERKVRILNGAHTSASLAAYLSGRDTVLEAMEDTAVSSMLRETIYGEVIPTLSLPEEELQEFAAEVFNRFENPYMRHELLSISLNSVSKWTARCLPTLLAYVQRFGKLPVNMTFSLAALLAFYTGSKIRDGKLDAVREGERQGAYTVSDDPAVLSFFQRESGGDTAEYVHNTLSMEPFWGQDLTRVEGLEELVTIQLAAIREHGMKAAIESCTQKR